MLNKYKQQLNFIKLNVENHFIKNYAYYSAIFQSSRILLWCYCIYKSLEQPRITYNSSVPPIGGDTSDSLPELGPNPFSSLVQSILSGEIPRRPLPCTRYTELTPGVYQVTGGASIEIYKKDNVSPTRLVGIYIPDTSDLEGTNPTRKLGAREIGGALFELRDKGLSAITRANTRNTPEVHDYVRAHAELAGSTPGSGITITPRLIDGFVDMQIPK